MNKDASEKWALILQQIGKSDELDDFSIKNFKNILSVHLSNTTSYLYKIKIKLDDKDKEDLLTSFLAMEKKNILRIYFTNPLSNVKWEYITPVVLLEIGEKSYIYTLNVDHIKGTITSSTINKEEVIIRVYVRKYFYPESIKNYSVRGVAPRKLKINFKLFEPEKFIEFLDTSGLFPMEIGVVAYTKQDRYSFVIDLMQSAVKMDVRNEKLPPQLKIKRSINQYLLLDTILANADLSEDSKIIMEAIFESNSITYMELLDMLKIPTERLDGYLSTLESKKWITKEGKYPKAVYLVDEEFLNSSNTVNQS
ncbi:MAG: hypothetical protein M1481_00530 [Candidatus Thermoplasmatota archaeon]|jgi:hypothetical protein|nr:hypothetical protein [Candidatus Thermoplasmatota archaeon]MCL5962858.1 hypothetical protein [Candidatus Thermoplasmatota archaeon]